MESEIKELCDKFGGLWQFVKSLQYEFCEQNLSALGEIAYAIKEYRDCKRELRINYLGLDDQYPKYDINYVKQILEKGNVLFSETESEERLRKIAYEYCKLRIRRSTEKSLMLRV